MAHRIRVYPHNDLLNLAHHQREQITFKVASGNHEGLTLDCQACVISLAFSVEAIINFVGDKAVDVWNERANAPTKLLQVCEATNIPHDLESEPLSTIVQLRNLRNEIAHAKPKESVVEIESREELRSAMSPMWSDFMNPEFVEAAYQRVKEFKKGLLDGSGIPIGQTITSAVGA